MSQTNEARGEPSTHQYLNRRTLGRIRKNVDKQGKRNVAIRFILAKTNKDKIAAWKQDLLRILQIFTVRHMSPDDSL